MFTDVLGGKHTVIDTKIENQYDYKRLQCGLQMNQSGLEIQCGIVVYISVIKLL